MPLPEKIAAHFDVSRATAYRWRNAWCDANGIEIPPACPAFRFAPPAFPAAHKSGGNRQPRNKGHQP